MKDNSFSIDGSECNPWDVRMPATSGAAAQCNFAPQATAPMPLEAIQDLFGKWVRDEKDTVLLPQNRGQDTVWVTKDFFQASSPPGGLDKGSLKDDLSGFFSLVLSYAKYDKYKDDQLSIKSVTPIMPRNDFSSIWKRLKDDDAVPTIQGSLWDLISTLACYKNVYKSSDVE
jgi:hypothetical protein